MVSYCSWCVRYKIMCLYININNLISKLKNKIKRNICASIKQKILQNLFLIAVISVPEFIFERKSRLS